MTFDFKTRAKVSTDSSPQTDKRMTATTDVHATKYSQISAFTRENYTMPESLLILLLVPDLHVRPKKKKRPKREKTK